MPSLSAATDAAFRELMSASVTSPEYSPGRPDRQGGSLRRAGVMINCIPVQRLVSAEHVRSNRALPCVSEARLRSSQTGD